MFSYTGCFRCLLLPVGFNWVEYKPPSEPVYYAIRGFTWCVFIGWVYTIVQFAGFLHTVTPAVVNLAPVWVAPVDLWGCVGAIFYTVPYLLGVWVLATLFTHCTMIVVVSLVFAVLWAWEWLFDFEVEVTDEDLDK